MDDSDTQPEPHVGILWHIKTSAAQPVLLVESAPLSSAEPYGDFLTFGGHYTFWTKLSAMSPQELRRRGLPDVAKWSEYEEWPRGRVVFHLPTRHFVIYADRKLMTEKTIANITTRFQIPSDQFDVRSDPHYVSVR